jgi:hypothetical protein
MSLLGCFVRLSDDGDAFYAEVLPLDARADDFPKDYPAGSKMHRAWWESANVDALVAKCEPLASMTEPPDRYRAWRLGMTGEIVEVLA